MNNIGIIAEYNPFHNGHLYHLTETKNKSKADNIVVIMSGNFVQRGEPAVYDKWIRAEMAVKGGADLVIELPFIFACNNAEYFAHGAVKILDKLNVISALSFGSEAGDVEELVPLARLLTRETEEFKDGLRDNLSKGLSFPRARYETVKKLTNPETAEKLTEPNNILAIEYLKQLMVQDSKIQAMTVKREGQGHYESATSIRKAIGQNKDFAQNQDIEQFLPETSTKTMKTILQKPVTDSEKLFPLIMYKILTSSEEELAQILSSGEGLEYKLKKAAVDCKDYEELVNIMLSKRYTQTRIKRLLIHTLMSLTKDNFFRMQSEANLYARVLAFSRNGADLLRYIRKNELSEIPVLTNINKELEKDNPMWEVMKYDIVAADIYNLCYCGSIYSRSDHVMKPFGLDI